MGRQLDKMDEISQNLQESDDGDYVLPRPLKVGDRVFVKTLGNEAEVVSIDEKKNTAQVQSGMIKMKADITDLRLIGAKKQPKKVAKIGRNESCPCGSGKKYKQCCGK